MEQGETLDYTCPRTLFSNVVAVFLSKNDSVDFPGFHLYECLSDFCPFLQVFSDKTLLNNVLGSILVF